MVSETKRAYQKEYMKRYYKDHPEKYRKHLEHCRQSKKKPAMTPQTITVAAAEPSGDPGQRAVTEPIHQAENPQKGEVSSSCIEPLKVPVLGQPRPED